LRQYIIERGNDLVCVALNARHALGQKPTIDCPASCINAVVGTFHHSYKGQSVGIRLEARGCGKARFRTESTAAAMNGKSA
jgi:hypothetical protein